MNNDNRLEPEPLLTTGEVAALFRVDTKTVSRWVREARITSIRPGGRGHHRFREADIRALLNGQQS